MRRPLQVSVHDTDSDHCLGRVTADSDEEAWAILCGFAIVPGVTTLVADASGIEVNLSSLKKRFDKTNGK